jgi:acylphosphatase
LGLKGWVRNEADGSVRVTAVGPEADLKRLVEFLHRGSPGALVSRVEVNWAEAGREYGGFEVRW